MASEFSPTAPATRRIDAIVRPPRLGDLAYAKLKEAIINLTLEPGALYSEKELSQLLNVSKAPVREALVRLKTEGWIDVHPNRGVRIRDIDEVEVREAFQLRAAIEGWVVFHLPQILTPPGQDAIRASLARQHELVACNDKVTWVAENINFHLSLARPLHNRYILNILGALSERIQRMGLALLIRQNRIADTLAEHEQIADAVLRRDGEMARTLMHQHLERTAQLLGQSKGAAKATGVDTRGGQ